MYINLFEHLDAGVTSVLASIENIALTLRCLLVIFLLFKWTVDYIQFGNVRKRFKNNHIYYFF